MLKIQKDFLNYLKNLENLVSKYEIIDNKNILDLKERIKNQELIIPVIGGFSVGKSSALNSFIKKNVLPVGVAPETDLATEIRYSDNERIEAVRGDESIDLYGLGDFDKIKENSNNYKYLRLYINSDNIRKVEPLILVDMPGFESPLDKHNKAIIEYIKKGVFYIVLVNVENGTIKSEILKELYNLHNLNKDFIVVLSQTNLRDDRFVEEVKEAILDLLELELDYNKEILTIGLDASESFNKILSELNPQRLFENIFIEELRSLYFDLIDNINLTISSLSKSRQENERAIKELEESLKELEEEKEKLIKEAKEEYSSSQVKIIINKVIGDVLAKKHSLAKLVVENSVESFNREIENTIRYSLTLNLKSSIENISLDVLNDLSSKLEQNIKYLDPLLIENITKYIRVLIENGSNSIQKSLNNLKNQTKVRHSLRTIFSILAIVTEVLTPAIEVLVLILPELIEGLFKNFIKEKQINSVEKIIENEIVPKIRETLQLELEKLLEEQINYIIESISNEFEEKLQEKKAILEEVSKQKEKEIKNLEAVINEYKELEANIREISTFLFKGE